MAEDADADDMPRSVRTRGRSRPEGAEISCFQTCNFRCSQGILQCFPGLVGMVGQSAGVETSFFAQQAAAHSTTYLGQLAHARPVYMRCRGGDVGGGRGVPEERAAQVHRRAVVRQDAGAALGLHHPCFLTVKLF